ncbi:hypothetical protein PTE30175_05106 [Pandoraea terrae]|uniref:Uncharacterized protein n=1 Tax=Pandoraea terrae TaxID=1537710 RepID=A0A5E4Z8P3_9BURK|nr:hypothetical protein [Pandoraea terrae]VVE57506.1 hypothetical protein PTE30175_05106 [Pandoraea terrae]
MKPNIYAIPRATRVPRRGKKSAARRRTTREDTLDAATVDEAALAPLPTGSTTYDGLLLANVKDLPLTISFPTPPNAAPGFGDTVQLRIDGIDYGDPIPITVDDEGGIMTVEIAPEAREEERKYVVTYIARYISGGGSDTSFPVQFIVDLTPPGNPFLGELEFPTDIEENGLDGPTLDGPPYNGTLTAMVPSYQGMAEGDIVVPMIGSTELDGVEVPVGGVGVEIELPYPRADLENAGDGRLAFAYRVTDRAGNASPASAPNYIDVFLSGGIDDLLAPTVAEVEEGGLIDEQLARAQVTVVIPGHDSIEEGDGIVIHWGGRPQAAIPVRAEDVGQDPLMEVKMPYSELHAEFFGEPPTDPDETPKQADVLYQVKRDNFTRGTSPALPVDVDLTTAGGPDPDPGTPEHENLAKPIVRSASWTGGAPENEIPIEDSNSDATAIIAWYDVSEPEPGEVFQAGDEITLYWKDKIIGNRVVSGTDVTDKLDLNITVPAAEIIEGGSGIIPVHYTITRALSLPGQNNVALSPTQDVTVVSAGDLPGGGDPLEPARWMGVNEHNTINQAEAIDGTTIGIRKYANIDIGDRIELHYEALDWVDNSPIPGAEADISKTVGQDDVADPDEEYVYLLIPEAPLMAVLAAQKKLADATVTYKVTNASGSVEENEGKHAYIDLRGSKAM